MKTSFPGWYAKTPEELKALWDASIIVPDTNILLHLVRHSANVRSQLMAVFDRKRDELWIPYQVGVEFQRRRLDVQQGALDAYDRLVEDLISFGNQTRNRLSNYRAHPVIDVEAELAALDRYISTAQERMAEAKARHPSDELAASFERVTMLFEGRVGTKPTAERLAAIRKEGEERYAKKTPPGFEDAKKDAGDKFGDLIIWKEMIEKAKSDQRPVIFVTDDGKADWWYIHHGKKVGPHPELVEEFLTDTGQQFHIYDLPQFLRYSVETGSAIQPDAVQQITETVIADSESAVTQTENVERAVAINGLRAEIRGKELELDGLIKALIDFPLKSSEPEATRRDDTRVGLKVRIAELTEIVGALRQRLGAIESSSG